jgi:cytochrome c
VQRSIVTGSPQFTRVVAVLVIGLAGPEVQAQTPRALLEHYRCNSCHTEREARTGPAFVDVASKYRGDPRAVATLTAAVKRGAHGAGPWHMPPHPELSDKDARTIVEYILSLRP